MQARTASSLLQPAAALPDGSRLAEFRIRRVLGAGGFGIVYLAFDEVLQREVAIKEYLPARLAGRTRSMHVSLHSQADAEGFALGLRSFVNEARLLARFDHPSLVKVHRFWEANGTAYMVMPAYRGRTLKAMRGELPRTPDEAWMRRLLEPLLAAIDCLHAEGVTHRDISPDNILVEPDGRPVLLDFGAARRVIEDRSRMLTAILKPAYAPIEQYAERGAVRQGPWTDLYALGATLHFVLRGRPPSPATVRAVHDDLQPLQDQGLPGFSPAFLAAIDWMLAPRPADRPPSVAALRDALDGRRSAPVRPFERRRAVPPPAAATGADAVVTRPAFPSVPPSPEVAPWRGEAAARRWVPALMAATMLVAGAAWAYWPAALPGRPGADVAAADPREGCARHSLLGLAGCLQRECDRAARRDHPQCLAWRAEQTARARSATSPG